MKRGFLNGRHGATTEPQQGPVKLRRMPLSPTIFPNEPAVKLSYGNIDASSRLPADHKTAPARYQIHDGTRADYDATAIVMTALPPQPEHAKIEDVPGGWTECILTGSAKGRILSTPGFPRDPPKPALVDAYRIVESPGKGLGVFANKPIRAGELILAERAIILSQASMEIPDDCPAHYTDEQVRQACLAEREKMLKVLFTRVPPERKAAYMTLCNSHLSDGSGPLMGIMRTNGFGITIEPEKGVRGFYTAVFDHLSRLNHTCSPNTARRWNFKTFSMQLYAVRDIEKDEEMTVEYTGLTARAAARKKELASYGVPCKCKACCDSVASDRRRLEIAKFRTMTPEVVQRLGADPRLPDHVLLKPVLDCLENVRLEGLEGTKPFKQALLSAVYCYGALGDEAKVAEFGKRLRLFDAMDSEKDRVLPDNILIVSWLKEKGLWNIRNQASSSKH